MLSLSHSGTLKFINQIAEDYDVNVQYWSDELLENLKVIVYTNVNF